jgi:hypothetical protein
MSNFEASINLSLKKKEKKTWNCEEPIPSVDFQLVSFSWIEGFFFFFCLFFSRREGLVYQSQTTTTRNRRN